jgi:hypothetical protein
MWIDARGETDETYAVERDTSQRLKELLGQRAKQCGRPRVSGNR